MKKIILFSFAFCFHLNPAPMFAWGSAGHKVTADVSKVYLVKNVRDSVQKYLGVMTFQEAGTWMDDFKNDTAYKYMKPWHFIYFDRDRDSASVKTADGRDSVYVKTNIKKDSSAVKTKAGNIVTELEFVIEQLKDKSHHSKAEINMYLKILFHLTADIQMPLHTGYGSDDGGNSIEVDFLGKKSNLHLVWDGEIIESKNIKKDFCLKLAMYLSPKEIKEIQKINVEKWMNDSRALLDNVYDFKDGMITSEYVDRNAPIIEKQLLIGGLRLAAVLNEVFKN